MACSMQLNYLGTSEFNSRIVSVMLKFHLSVPSINNRQIHYHLHHGELDQSLHLASSAKNGSSLVSRLIFDDLALLSIP